MKPVVSYRSSGRDKEGKGGIMLTEKIISYTLGKVQGPAPELFKEKTDFITF